MFSKLLCNQVTILICDLVVTTFKSVLIHVGCLSQYTQLHGVGAVRLLLRVRQELFQSIALTCAHVFGNLPKHSLQLVQSFLWQSVLLSQISNTSYHVRQGLVHLFCRGVVNQAFKKLLVNQCCAFPHFEYPSANSIVDVQHIHLCLNRVRSPAIKRVSCCRTHGNAWTFSNRGQPTRTYRSFAISLLLVEVNLGCVKLTRVTFALGLCTTKPSALFTRLVRESCLNDWLYCSDLLSKLSFLFCIQVTNDLAILIGRQLVLGIQELHIGFTHTAVNSFMQ